MLAWMGGKAWLNRSLVRKIATTLYNVGLFFVAPFVALAYIILLPPIGLVMLVGMGG